MRKIILFFQIIILSLPVALYAQTKTIRGTVKDADGILPGVTIIEKGLPSNGTVTDSKGNFALVLKGTTDRIIVRFIGDITQDISVAGKTTVDIIMNTNAHGIDEVSVVGYGKTTRITNTGAVSSINAADVREVPTANVQNTLAGRLPGFFSQQSSGQPGKDASDFFIRGQSSLNPSGNEPLIIVDDIEYTYDQLQQINVNEIETISILKDASTTAVYGIKGANGVLVVTTRRGKSGINYIYSGQGGLSKAYIGYGFSIGHLQLGANVSYIFGNLQQFSSTEIPTLAGTLNSSVENSYSIGGINYDYGAQYTIDLSNTKHVILGYSGSANTSINSQYSNVVSQYTYDASGNQNVPLDTLQSTKGQKTKIQLPQLNHFGLTYVSDGKYMVGGEYSTGNWSQLTIGGVNQNLQNSKTYNLGGQFTPNINALSNYWATINYRLGFIYDQTYIDVNNPVNNTSTNITSYAVTFGLGMPLRPNESRTAFYEVNFSAEVGKRGTLENYLVKENYVNLHLSFTLNDKWFTKYRITDN